MTTAPALTAAAANSLERDAPALNRAMSMPLKASCVSSSTGMDLPRNIIFFPTDRSEASSFNVPTGKLRFSSVSIISTPTAPVAPTIAILYVLLTCPILRFSFGATNYTKPSAPCKRVYNLYEKPIVVVMSFFARSAVASPS